ncbi:MAG: quinol:cytochrome C oxidoreductase [Myxococcales bacterium]
MSNDRTTQGRQAWRSLEARADAQRARELAANEFGPETFVVDDASRDVSRRGFLGVMGASMALAGTALAGCVRKPLEHILPYTKRPEDLIPGSPMYFATSAWIGGSVHGLLVESHEGRPTKVEGNPQHPSSSGATSHWAQASVLGLYDPDRSKAPATAGKDATWEAALGAVRERFTAARAESGAGVAILVEPVPSPSVWRALSDLLRALPQAALYGWEPARPGNGAAGGALVEAGASLPSYELDKADVILSVDADFLGAEPDAVRHGRQFASRRRVKTPADTMNRLYVVEPNFSVTGAMADHRLRSKGSRVGEVLIAIARALGAQGVTLPVGGLEPRGTDARVETWATAVAKDLAASRGRSLVLVGERQAPWVHALGHAINEALGNTGTTLRWLERPGAPALRSIGELAQAIDGAQVKTLVVVGCNPAYDAPADLGLAASLPKVPFSVHLGIYRDETAQKCTWHIPQSHYLEAWGDLVATDGTASIQQPLIAPLYDTVSDLELLATLAVPDAVIAPRGYELVRQTWATRATGDFEKEWRRWLHDGVITTPTPRVAAPPFSWAPLTTALGSRPTPADGLEVSFIVDPSVYDGRYANLGWLQELPDPMTKLTWDNAAVMGPALAKKLGVEFDTASGGNQERPLVQVTVEGRSLTVGTFVSPGIAEDTVILALGYGRKGLGRVAEGAGFDTYALRGKATLFDAPGATVTKVPGGYRLASTQDHGSMEGRPIVREATLDGFRKDPGFVEKAEVMPADKIKSLWDSPWETAYRGEVPLHKWGMAIDLNVCTGCSACTVACQAENNISVVGKEQVLKGREMHWIRLDRYFIGDDVDEPEAAIQPMLCQQCENAPCESVCPVAATTHSPEGLNDMAYNRCIGTRYCANNCPYKVRRFNFHNFNLHIDPVSRMQKNPDVTVRFRGVMEKCTFCVQRIQEAKIVAKRDGNGVVPDGTIVPACAQSCPTDAIVFGDLNDPKSAVSLAKAEARNYTVLAELNLYTRNSYLAKLRNPNPELV